MALADAYARALKALLPPGRLWRLDAESIVTETLTACADELARVDGRAKDLLREADPTTTDELLPDFEAIFGLPATGTIDQRRARVVSRLVRRSRFRPVDFQNVLAPLLDVAPADVGVLEQSHATAVALGDARKIYQFFIYRNPALPGTPDFAAAQEMVDRMKPSHTLGQVIASVNFLCDDPNSLCDRDRLGV